MHDAWPLGEEMGLDIGDFDRSLLVPDPPPTANNQWSGFRESKDSALAG